MFVESGVSLTFLLQVVINFHLREVNYIFKIYVLQTNVQNFKTTSFDYTSLMSEIFVPLAVL